MTILRSSSLKLLRPAQLGSERVVEDRGRRVIRFLIGTMLAIPGCINSENTRMPQCMSYFPAAENRAFQRQNPFSDPDIGPSTDFAPRGYDRPRSEAQRAAEERTLRGLPVGPESVNPGLPTGSRSRSRSVY